MTIKPHPHLANSLPFGPAHLTVLVAAINSNDQPLIDLLWSRFSASDDVDAHLLTALFDQGQLDRAVELLSRHPSPMGDPKRNNEYFGNALRAALRQGRGDLVSEFAPHFTEESFEEPDDDMAIMIAIDTGQDEAIHALFPHYGDQNQVKALARLASLGKEDLFWELHTDWNTNNTLAAEDNHPNHEELVWAVAKTPNVAIFDRLLELPLSLQELTVHIRWSKKWEDHPSVQRNIRSVLELLGPDEWARIEALEIKPGVGVKPAAHQVALAVLAPLAQQRAWLDRYGEAAMPEVTALWRQNQLATAPEPSASPTDPLTPARRLRPRS